MDIAGSIAAVSSALTIVKEIKEIDAQLDQASLKLKIAELTEALAEAKLGLVDVLEDLRMKDQEISRLNDQLRYRAENLIDYNGFRYQNVEGSPKGRPYCPACEAKGLYIMVAQDRNTPGHPYKCPSCRADFGYSGVYKA
ncbi:hypothetical protein GCM10011385_00180 [Nitratireductor aestuarii]|uniref:Uncharacterized protein n=1 Tax=Nitratireductor aestuarii TaxID=1735103 RepID=A0A916RC80_9HYPH|nr:hypothetical protein [Nitratireductor aestuarii]GGA50908.1 hypothetical protein GCM10011385_00180 [Nitratireductor aestuarii]